MGDARDDVDPDAAFGALSDPIRVAIVRTLAEHRRRNPENPALGFAALRKRVDVRDSGRFLYHLKKLLDVFVEKTDEETYRLTFAGEQVAIAILAGLFTGRVHRGPTELDSECPLCGAGAVGTFDDGTLSVTCGEGHRLLAWQFPPKAAEDATVPELSTLATTRIRHEVESALMGTCGACYGTTTTTADPTDASPISVRFHAECEDCGSRLDGPLWYALFAHPETTAFYRDHGWSVRETYLWEFEGEVRETPFPGDDGERAGETHHVVVALDDEELHAALDGDGHVVRTTTLSSE